MIEKIKCKNCRYKLHCLFRLDFGFTNHTYGINFESRTPAKKLLICGCYINGQSDPCTVRAMVVSLNLICQKGFGNESDFY